MELEVRAGSENVNDVNAFPTFLSVSRGKTNIACRRCATISHDDITVGRDQSEASSGTHRSTPCCALDASFGFTLCASE